MAIHTAVIHAVCIFNTDELSHFERQRILEAIRSYDGDAILLPHAKEELEGAVGLMTNVLAFAGRPLQATFFCGRKQDCVKLSLPND